MASSSSRGETFHEFFEQWLVGQNEHLEELVSALAERERLFHGRLFINEEELDATILRPTIARALDHYRHYYRVKQRWASDHVTSMFKPPWTSSLEGTLMWIGGWRPSTAIQLLYSKLGIQLDSRIHQILRGRAIGDLGDINMPQLTQVNILQTGIMSEEMDINEEFMMVSVTDPKTVKLSHTVSNAMRQGGQVHGGRVEAALRPKEERMAEVLRRADGLRMRTLEQLVGALTPRQGVFFLIAAAELHLRVHEWGKGIDARDHN
ncbi:tgacg-sequence-specific DNA-binding protein tga-2.1 [Phtheirospermum japonicum]|uniref:Tgacg-sequence-specific DNA-binding protein tga-2.1 n=1 Tax=Phtheirospermum japonicum TaxID=374723 RepID=A0A830C2U8_9LAMI|nr:tgacg-sequence-specific DNA-binding protein tga-2.1 [Phtheirospermum japonicum]